MNTTSIDKQSILSKKYWHFDSGHSWLAVERQDIIDLCLIKQISKLSYIDEAYVYLEKDCDAKIYFKACDIRLKILGIKESYEVYEVTDSKIRLLPAYNASKLS